MVDIWALAEEELRGLPDHPYEKQEVQQSGKICSIVLEVDRLGLTEEAAVRDAIRVKLRAALDASPSRSGIVMPFDAVLKPGPEGPVYPGMAKMAHELQMIMIALGHHPPKTLDRSHVEAAIAEYLRRKRQREADAGSLPRDPPSPTPGTDPPSIRGTPR